MSTGVVPSVGSAAVPRGQDLPVTGGQTYNVVPGLKGVGGLPQRPLHKLSVETPRPCLPRKQQGNETEEIGC